MRARRSAVVPLVLAIVCTACVPVPIIVPVFPHNEEGKPINEDRIAFIRPWVTTKADVVWELGAPNNESSAADADESGVASEDWISYKGSRHRGGVAGGVVIFPLPPFPGKPTGGGAERVCRRPWVLKIWFNEAGVVTRREFTQGETECRSQPW